MHGMRHKLGALAVCAFSGAFVAEIAADPVPPELEKWIDAEIAGANALERFPLLRIDFSRHTHADMNYPALSVTEIADLESRVAGKVDHPDRDRLDVAKRRGDVGEEEIFLLLWRAPDEWRVSQTIPRLLIDIPARPLGPLTNPPGKRKWSTARTQVPMTLDTTWRHDVRWRVVLGTTLSHTTPQIGYPPSANEEGTWNAARLLAMNHLTGSMCGSAFKDSSFRRVGPPRVASNKWEVDVAGAGTEARYKGRWDATHGRGFVEECLLVRSRVSQCNGMRTTFDDWGEYRVGERTIWAAVRVHEYLPTGSLGSESRATSVAALSNAEFEAATAVPDPAIPDPIRGGLAIIEILDYTQPEQRRTLDSVNGTLWRTQDIGPSSSGTNALRAVGWATLGTCIAGLVAMRYRRYVLKR